MIEMSANKAYVDKTISKEIEKRQTVQDIYDIKRYLEPIVTRDVTELRRSLGVSFVGLEHSVKTASSFESKIRRTQAKALKRGEKIDSVIAASRIIDVVRYTQICDHQKIFDVAKDTIKELENKGYLLSSVKNYYANPFSTTGYRGLHLNFISPQGVPFELQVHSTESFDAKNEGHELYERMRALSTPVEEKERLEPIIRSVHGRFPDPPGIDTIKDMELPEEEVNAFLENLPEITISTNECKQAKQYEVCQDGNPIVSGIELSFDDKSTFAIRKLGDSDKAEVLSFNERGADIVHKEVNAELLKGIRNLEDAKDMREAMQCASILWLKGYQEQSLEMTKCITFHMDTPEKIMKGVADKDRYIYGLVNGSGVEELKKELLKNVRAAGREPDKRRTKISDDLER